MAEYTRNTIHLPDAVPSAEPKTIEVPNAVELEIVDYVGASFIRLGADHGADDRPIRREIICVEDFDVVQIHTEGVDIDGSLTYEKRRFSIRSKVQEAAAGGPASLPQERASGALAPGETIAPGEELSEQFNTEGADRVRVRARVDGIASYSEIDDDTVGAASADAVYDPDNDRVFVNETGSDVVEYDVSTPGAPTEVDRLSLTGAGGGDKNIFNRRGPTGLAPADGVLVVVGTTTNANLTLWQIDVSTPGAMVEDGSAGFSDQPLDTGHAVVSEGSLLAYFPTTGGMKECDVSGASPSFNTDLIAGEVSNPALDQDRGLLFLTEGSPAQLRVYSMAGGTPTVQDAVGLSSNTHDGADIRLDEANQKALVATDDDTGADPNLYLVDYQSPSTLAVLDSVEDTNINGRAERLLIEDTGQEPVVWLRNGANSPWSRYTYISGSLEAVGTFAMNGAVFGHVVYYVASGVPYIFVPQASTGDNWTLWSGTGGDVDLLIAPVDQNGNRYAQGRSSRVTLTDGGEGMVTLDLVGEENVDGILLNRGAEQGAIEYFDVTREAL